MPTITNFSPWSSCMFMVDATVSSGLSDKKVTYSFSGSVSALPISGLFSMIFSSSRYVLMSTFVENPKVSRNFSSTAGAIFAVSARPQSKMTLPL